MAHNVAVFLDLDNLLIGATEARLPFDIGLVLDHVKEITNGRVVMRRAYGDYRQNQQVPRQLAHAGFELQSVVRLNNSDKNLADMQMVADAVETLIDGYRFETYVIITGDRDFMPLVQVLRRHDKHVIGLGVQHTANASLVELCDQYIFYDGLVPSYDFATDTQLEIWMQKAAKLAFQTHARIQASVFREYVQRVSDEKFGRTAQGKGSFSKLLEQFPSVFKLERELTTLYVLPPDAEAGSVSSLHLRYRSALKKRGLRVVIGDTRLRVQKDLLELLCQADEPYRWQNLIETLASRYASAGHSISKSIVNDVMRLARRAKIISVTSNGSSALSNQAVTLALKSNRLIQDAVMQCDYCYVSEIRLLPDTPFDIEEAALALYDSVNKAPYIEYLLNNFK